MREISRSGKAKLNITVSLVCQVVTLLCGLVVPRLMIGFYGSEAYGATMSIAQFLSYITLLEGGIGGVARAALYKPLAENDGYRISAVVWEIKRFFRIVAYVFVVYVLFLAFTFKDISGITCMDGLSTVLLVLVISLSTFMQYFIGISYSVLLQAAQKTYITNVINIGATLLNTGLAVVLVYAECSLLTVKLVSSIVFVLKPFVIWLYVRATFALQRCKERHGELLSQKWTGLGQHIAYFFHSHTDVAILTVMTDLRNVAVYSVYSMVVSQMQNLIASFSAGMEALFGDMLAKKEYETLHRTFGYYESLISFVTSLLFSITAVMIVPFVKIYTAGVTDANYTAPLFAILFVLASVVYCLRQPYHSLVIAAGHFKETKIAAYGEAILNIGITVALVNTLGLVGAALGTLIANAFRFGFYVIYISKNIIQRRVSLFVKREMVNFGSFAAVCFFGSYIMAKADVMNYFEWFLDAAAVGAAALIVITLINFVFYKEDVVLIFNRFIKKKKLVK